MEERDDDDDADDGGLCEAYAGRDLPAPGEPTGVAEAEAEAEAVKRDARSTASRRSSIRWLDDWGWASAAVAERDEGRSVRSLEPLRECEGAGAYE